MQTQSAAAQTVPPLRQLRRAHGVSLRALSERTDIDIAHLSRYERGQSSLSLNALHRIAQVLDLRDLGQLIQPWVRAS